MIKLDWIQNYGGTQYIDTGFKPNQDTRIVMRVSEPGNNAWFFSVWSTYQWNSNNYSFINDAASSAGKVFACYGNKTGGGIPVITGENNIDFNKNTLTVNGNVVNTFENNTFQALYNLFLFARSYVGNVQYASAVSDFRLHNCQIYDNDVLVRDFVPALDEDFVICLYDRVTETYFYNKGSGAFKGAFPQSAKTWEIQQETLEQFADEARRLGCVAGKLTTTEMLDVFSSTTPAGPPKLIPAETPTITTLETRLPWAISNFGSVVVDGKIYYYGGGSKAVIKFDPETEEITNLGDVLPNNIDTAGTALVGKKIYIFGGRSNGSYVSTIWCYDIETNTTEVKSARVAAAVMGIGCVAVERKVYLFGGFSNSDTKIQIYDTETDTIVTSSTILPFSAALGAIARYGRNIFILGGWVGSASSNIQIYNIDTNTVNSLRTGLPYGTGYTPFAVIGSTIFMLGGRISSSATNQICSFDMESFLSKKLNVTLPYDNTYGRCEAIGKTIYLMGGHSTSTNIGHDEIIKFEF